MSIIKKIGSIFFNKASRKKGPIIILGIFIFLGIFHPFIANEKPLFAKQSGKFYFPVLSSVSENLSLKKSNGISAQTRDYDFKIMPLIPYSYNTIDHRNGAYKSPFESQKVDNLWQRHWLGTDVLGRDVLAGILKGTGTSIKIGFLSVLLGFIIACILGFSGAYYQRFPKKQNIIDLILMMLWISGLGYYLWVGLKTSILYVIGYILIMMPIIFIYRYVKSKFLNNILRERFILPVDGLLMRILEAMKSIPLFIFLLACISILENINSSGLIIILGLLIWPGFTRYIRAESMKVLSQDYITAAKAYGASGFRILRVHVLPKIFTSLSVILAFGVSSVILLESTLSFLGIGLPIEEVSWGSMLKDAKTNFSAWWMAIFPGIAIFLLILNLNLLGEDLEKDMRIE